MKKSLFFLLMLLCASTSVVFAQLVNYDDKIIDDLHTEYIQKGKMPPFFFGPVLAGQVNRASKEIGSSHYIDVEDKNGANFFISFAPTMHYYSKDESIEDISLNAANNGIDYAKNYLSMPAFTSFGFAFFSEIGLGGRMTVSLRAPFTNDYFALHNIGADRNLLDEGFIYFDNPYVSITAGRIHNQMGLPHGDAVFFNNDIPYTDTVRMYIPFGKYFNLNWQITNIPAVESKYQKDVTTGNDVFISGGSTQNTDYFLGFENDDFPSVILNTYQRFGFQNDFLRTGLSLNVFLVRRNNRFEFADLFPFAEWHSTDVAPNNMSLGLDFSFVPTKNLLFDFQVGFDEINGTSIGLESNKIPTIWKFIGTMQNTLATDTVNVLFATNFGYSHYLWGNFDGTSVGDRGKAELAMAIYRHNLINPMIMPFTSSYGPGTMWFSQEAVIGFSGNPWLSKLKIAPEVFVLLYEKGTNLFETDYTTRTNVPPKSIYSSIEVPISYSWRTLSLSVAPSFHIKGLNQTPTTWFELKLSFKANFSSSIFEKNEELCIKYEY